jgi:tight adherence protein B
MPSPTRDEFVRVVNEMGLGLPPSTALLAIYHRTGLAEYAIFAVTLAVQSRSGGRLAETIQSLAETVRQRVALAARTRALASEATLSAQILSGLPFAAAAGLSLIRPGYLDPLFYDPKGQRLFYFGIVTLVMGIVTMRRLVVGATRQ